MLINHAASGLPPLNDDVVHGVIDIRVRNAYAFLISGLTEIAMRLLQRPIPIVLHGHDYAVPDGRGVLGGFGFLPGPWLQPGFHRKGHGDTDANVDVMEQLINTFNAMLRQLAGAVGFGHVRYVDLRGTLSNAANYKRDWANELHPTERGFRSVAQKIADAVSDQLIGRLLVGFGLLAVPAPVLPDRRTRIVHHSRVRVEHHRRACVRVVGGPARDLIVVWRSRLGERHERRGQPPGHLPARFVAGAADAVAIEVERRVDVVAVHRAQLAVEAPASPTPRCTSTPAPALCGLAFGLGDGARSHLSVGEDLRLDQVRRLAGGNRTIHLEDLGRSCP